MESILSSLIVGGLALIGVIITNYSSNKEIAHKLETSQAVTEAKIDHLTEEVKKHNNFAVRIPVMENQIKTIFHELNMTPADK